MQELKKLTPITLQQQLYAEILKSIEDGKYKPNCKIPTEFELSKTYNVSRVTVRAAIQQLVNENKLIKKAGKGTFVRQDAYNSIHLESGSFTENCLRNGATPATEIIECKFVLSTKQILNDLAISSKKIIQIKRIRYVDDVPCILEIDYFPEQFNFLLSNIQENKSLIKRIIKNTSLIPEIFVDKFSIEYANKEFKKYLNCSIRTPLLLVSQIVKTKSGKIIYFNKQYIVTSRYVYVKQ